MWRFAAGLLSLCLLQAARADDLTVLTPTSAGGPPKQMLTRALKQEAYDALERRRVTYEAVKTPDQWADYQSRLRKAFLEHLGDLPERTPLNARVVGAFEGERYRVEKVLFESQPRHYVTGVLFLPMTQKPPFPVVVMPCGHSKSGKVENQTPAILLAQHGIACFSYDPIGQGERVQLFAADGKSRFSMTTEHTLLGAGSIPLGRGTATYRIWDGMRAIDYVAGRKDIDAANIGVSGCSGGGTLSSYLMALDERVTCAAPSCYLTSWRRLLDTIGPQDAEQNIHGQLAFGMDHADYILMRAPRPTLILASTHDFFDIQGTWDTFRQAKRFYTRMGFGERVDMLETDAKHGYPKLQREAMLRWMRRWLAHVDEPVSEGVIQSRPASAYQCTETGQVLKLPGARSVVDLNVELNARYEPQRRKLWAGDRAAALAEVRRIAGIRPLSELPPTKHTVVGTVERKGYRIDKLILDTEPGVRLPALLFKPAAPTGRRVLYVHGSGKHVDAEPGGAIEKRVLAGEMVLAIDVRGVGELGTTDPGIWGGNWFDFFTAYLLGKSIVGMRAEDVLQAVRFLSTWDNAKAPIDLVAIGGAGVPALHAASLEARMIDRVRLDRSLASWSDLVRHPDAPGQMINTVHGALRAYDLPDLVASLPREKVTIEEPLDLAKTVGAK
jgi:cephalosporin-C deacetylase-like acetyl esterase